MVKRFAMDRLPSMTVEPPHDDDLALPIAWAQWVLEQVRARGLGLCAAGRGLNGVWQTCRPDEVLRVGTIASIGQRPSCGGVRTTLHLWDADGLCGACWLERKVGTQEDPAFRLALLQALLRASLDD
ncbi:MAG: hypothetical protein AAGA48_19675 [Myxococcota bacterium]